MGFGFELGYEREIGASGTVAYNLPVSVTFSPASKDLSKGDKQVQMFYFMPGIKLYPVGCRRKLRYAIGQSLIVGAGGQTINKPEWYTEPNWYRYELRDHFVTRNKLLVGTMFNNSLNATISRRLVLGLDIGLGFAYISKVDGINQGMKGLLQGGFRMGCKL